MNLSMWVFCSLPTLSEKADVSQVQCIVYVKLHYGPLTSPFMVFPPTPPPQEAAKAAELVLQSIFSGSPG